MLQELENHNPWELPLTEFRYRSKYFKFFSQRERDISIKIEILTQYLRIDPFREKFHFFLRDLKSFGTIDSAYLWKTGFCNEIGKKKKGKGVLYFEDTCAGENGFKLLEVEEKKLDEVEKFCEHYLDFILGFGEDIIEQSRRKTAEAFLKTLEQMNF